jgi:hypothetical protein
MKALVLERLLLRALASGLPDYCYMLPGQQLHQLLR